MAAVLLPVANRDVLPRQFFQLPLQGTLVAFHGEHVMGSAAMEVFRVGALGMHRVGRDHHVLEVRDGVQKVLEAGDFISLDADVNLSQNGAGSVVNGGHQVDPVTATVLRPADFLPIRGNGLRFHLGHDPGAQGGVEGISVHPGQHPLDGRHMRDSDAGPGQGFASRVGGPLSDLGKRLRPGKHGANRQNQDSRQPVPDAPALPRIRNGSKDFPHRPRRQRRLHRLRNDLQLAGNGIDRGRWHEGTPGTQ
ncbi:hypothetical protein V3C33_03775 [Micrococcaceae bacterium Sec5.7]